MGRVSRSRSTSSAAGRPAAGSERAAVQRRDRVRVGEDVLDVAVGLPEAAGGERAAEHVAGAGAVHARRPGTRACESRGPPQRARLPSAPSVTQTSGALELARHHLERPAEVLVAGQRGRKILGGDDRVDLAQQIGDAGTDLLDVHDGGNARLPRVPRRLRRGGGFVAVDDAACGRRSTASRGTSAGSIVRAGCRSQSTVRSPVARVDEDHGELVGRARRPCARR